MSIHKSTRKNGKVVYDVRYVDDAGKQRSRRFDRKADAEKFETEIRQRKQAGDLVSFEGGKVTLADFGREWLNSYARDNLAKQTLAGYAGVWDRYILPNLGQHTLRRLYADPKLIQQFSADLLEQGVGPEAVRTALVLLQGVLQRAVEWNRIPDNPVRKIRKPAKRGKRKATIIVPDTVERMRSILLEEDRMLDATLISVLAYAGLRPSEALALHWRDVAQRTLRVEGASYDGQLKDTKTGKTRSVRLLGPLIEDLAAWRAASSYDADDDLIFPRPDGRVWRTDDYKNWTNRVFHRVCIDLQLGTYIDRRVKGKKQKAWRAMNGESEGPRPYDLRHSFVSLLIHEGSSIVEVASNAGHAPTMTLNTYAHVIAEYDPTDRRSAEARILEARAGIFDKSSTKLDSVTSGAGEGKEKPRRLRGFYVKPMSGLEPLTPSLRVKCSTS